MRGFLARAPSRRVDRLVALAGLLLAPAASFAQTTSGETASITEAQLEAFRPRLIGPAVTGGRVHDVEALPHDPATLRVTSASGHLVQELIVPSDPGVHRVNWDLRHGNLDRPQLWVRHDDPRLDRPIDEKGPWVSPGTFTVTLEARGVMSVQTVEVRGDPLFPLRRLMYEEREAYLLDLLTLEGRIDEARPGLRCGRGPDRNRSRSLPNPEPSQRSEGKIGGTGSAARLTLSAHTGAYQKKISDRGSPRPHSPLHERRPLTAMSKNDE